MTNTNSSADLQEIGLSFGKFKVYICLREYYFYYLHFTNYEPEAQKGQVQLPSQWDPKHSDSRTYPLNRLIYLPLIFFDV